MSGAEIGVLLGAMGGAGAAAGGAGAAGAAASGAAAGSAAGTGANALLGNMGGLLQGSMPQMGDLSGLADGVISGVPGLDQPMSSKMGGVPSQANADYLSMSLDNASARRQGAPVDSASLEALANRGRMLRQQTLQSLGLLMRR